MFPELTFDEFPPAPPAGPQGLSGWVAHVRELDMPAFGSTVMAIRSIVSDDDASASRLAAVILRDPAMTTKVLRLANSAYFNTSRQGVSTISRAIVVLGFNGVADMAIGLALVDALLKGGVRTRVVDELSRCFFAATVARGLARMRSDAHAEEIFIAALLSRVGDMAFWCFGGAQAEALDRQLPSGCDAAQVQTIEHQVLGFRLRQLSLQLAREWHLGTLLHDVLDPAGRSNPQVDAIRLGHAVAQGVVAGWESPAFRAALREAAQFVNQSEASLREEIVSLAKAAARLATDYGATDVAGQIPVAADPPVSEMPPMPVPDPAERQLHILRELSVLIFEGGSFADAVCLACEGILQGVGFARVVVAMVTPNRAQVVGKYGLGDGGEAIRKRFVFTLGSHPGDPIDLAFANLRPQRLGGQRGRLADVAGAGPACLAPIVGHGRCIGMVYAERERGQPPVDDDTFHAFAHFVQHLTMAVPAPRPAK
ncbi:MAG: HDOD domain-containing protein [Rhodocyclaceae bacterium]|nr:HDOD domain-containing protein [Rhodocyclaceae bacterium]